MPIIGRAVQRYGLSEFRAAVLTNELHGHLGIFATVGVKMGIRAREYFDIGVDDMHVTTYAGNRPPVSCLNDGLQVSTGGTLGHGLITVAEVKAGDTRPEATFTFKNKKVTLRLKPEYERRVREDLKKGSKPTERIQKPIGNMSVLWPYNTGSTGTATRFSISFETPSIKSRLRFYRF